MRISVPTLCTVKRRHCLGGLLNTNALDVPQKRPQTLGLLPMTSIQLFFPRHLDVPHHILDLKIREAPISGAGKRHGVRTLYKWFISPAHIRAAFWLFIIVGLSLPPRDPLF